MKTILGGGKKKGSSRTKTSSSSSKDAKAKALIGKTIEVKNRRFKVKEILGEGGYSNVYRVVEEGSNNVFALKRMLVSADEMDLVKREVSLMKSIPPHRNLVHFECANVTTSAEQRKGEDLMEANIIMEYADVRLFDVMEARHTEGKYFTEAELIAIMVDVCEGVAVLHQHRPPIAHRDIKVENVLLGNDGAYKLCDFGSATSVTHHPKTAAERDAAEADIERNTTMVYRAPEMLDLYAAKPIDEKADIWALGCMLYKMCFFEDAFSIGGRLAILQANFSFPLAPKYSPELNECIKYMLELNAEERPSITAVIRRLQRLKAGLGQDTPGKHRRSRTWGGSQDNLHLDDIPPAAANAEDKVTSLHSSGASSNRERRKLPVVPRKTSSDLDTSFSASPPSPATEHKSSLRDSRRPRRESGHGRRELHFDGPTTGSGATNGGIDPNPNSRGSPVSDRAFAFPAPPSHHRKGSISASASPLLRPDTFPSPVLSPSSALKPGQLMPGGSPMMGMMSITPLGSGGTASLPHGLGGLSMVPLSSGGGSPSGGLTLTALPSGGNQGGLTMTPLAGGNQGGLTLTPIPSGGGGLTMTPLASGGNPGAGASHHGGLTLSPLASGGGNQGQQGGLTMTALASGGNHGGGGGLTMTPLVSGGGGGGLTMTPLASGGNQGGLTMTPLISGGGGGGLTMTPLASGGNQGGLAMTPLASGGLTMTALASGGNQGGLTLAQRNSGGLTMNPLTSGGGNQGHGGLTMAPLTSGGKTGIPTPYSSAASNGYHNLSPLASGEGAMGMSIKPLASGGTTRGPTTPTRAGAISKSSGGSGSGGGGGEMSIIPTISGSSREKEGKGEIITFEAMMKLIDREREEKDKRSHSVDSIESDVRGEGQEQGSRKPTTGSSKKKKNKKTRREILPGGTISSSDEDGLNMLASGEHDFASEGNKPEQTKLKKLRKSLQMKEKGFKEIRSKESVDDTATGGAKEKKANRKSKLFGKLGIEYAGEGPIDTDAGSHPDDEMSPFGVASSPTIPLSVALASTSKESKQAQFMNADIPLHQSFLKHNFDLDFVYTAEYLARKALAHGHRMWALAPADTPIDDVKIWAANGVTDSYFAHIKSRKLGNSYEDCLRCLLGLFKMLQEGSPCVLLECYQHLAWLQNLRKTAKMQEKAQLVQLMCTFLVKKIEFHRHHPQFEGTYSLQTHHAQKRQRSEQYAVDQAGSFQELEDLLGVQQALMDIPNLILMQLDTYKDDLALEALPLLVAESHAILSMSTYLLVKLKVFCFDKDKLGTFQELKGSYKALYYVLSRFYSQILHYTNMSPSLVPVLPPKQKISALLNVQVLQYPVSYNPHFAQVRLKTLSRELPKVAGQMQHHDKEREKKERREREKREKDEKKREKERSKLEKKREKGMKKGMRLPGKKIGKADLKKELKREMQKEWEEELERESVRGRDTRPSVAEASSMIPASPPPADAITTSNVEPLHSSVQRPVARRRLEPSMSSGAFQLPHQPQHPPHVHILGEEGRTVSLVEVPAITLQPEPEPHHSPLKRTHSRSKSYAGHEKVQINEFDVSRLISQQHPVYANASWNPFS